MNPNPFFTVYICVSVFSIICYVYIVLRWVKGAILPQSTATQSNTLSCIQVTSVWCLIAISPTLHLNYSDKIYRKCFLFSFRFCLFYLLLWPAFMFGAILNIKCIDLLHIFKYKRHNTKLFSIKQAKAMQLYLYVIMWFPLISKKIETLVHFHLFFASTYSWVWEY